MNGSLQTWIEHQVARIESQPRLDLALLTDRAWRYVVHRLSFLGARVVVRTAFHALEILLMLQSIPEDWAAVLLLLRTLSGVTGSLYWGALEPLRQQVREDVAAGRHARATAKVEGWIAVAWLFSSLLLVSAGGWVASQYSADTLTLGDLFGLGCAAKLAVTLLTRTFHAGVQAQRRVYRPLWSVLVPEFADFALLILLWPSIGLMALVVQVWCSCLLRGALTVFFTRRAYRGCRMPMPRWLAGVKNASRLGGSDAWHASRAALASGMAQLDGVLVLLLLAVSASDDADVSLGLLYYVLRPLMATAHDWTRAFYADFSRGDLASSGFFRRRLQRLLGRVSLVMAVVLCALVFIATWLIWQRLPPASTFWLLPFFVARAHISLRHLEAFTQGHHTRLALLTVGLFVSVIVLSRAALPAGWLAACGTLLLIAMWFGLPTKGEGSRASHLLSLPAWLHHVTSETQRVSLGVLRVDLRLVTPSRVIGVLRVERETIGLARVGRSHILWYEVLGESSANPAVAITRAGAGCVASAGSVVGMTGRDALGRAVSDGLLPSVVSEALAQPVVDDVALEDAFLDAHPGGVVLRSRAGVLPAAALSQAVQQQLMAAVATEASGHRAQGDASAVGVYAPRGEPHLVFIAPAGQAVDRQWRIRLRAATLRSSIAGG